jgi:DNA-binding XRE family transcriptional regulator
MNVPHVPVMGLPLTAGCVFIEVLYPFYGYSSSPYKNVTMCTLTRTTNIILFGGVMTTSLSYSVEMAGLHKLCMDSNDLGRYIRRVRMEQDITQDELARRWGKSQTTISAIEKGREVPREDIPSLAEALMRPVDEVWLAAGYSLDSLAGFRGKEVVHISHGKRGIVIAREGEPGVPLDIDQSVVDQLLALALLQQRRREGR